MHKLSPSQKIGNVTDKEFVTLDENTLVGVAAKIIRDKDISCILVNRPSQGIELAELQTPRNLTVLGTSIIRCPYCDLTCRSKSEITTHINEAHILSS